jgi:threonine dehydratase
MDLVDIFDAQKRIRDFVRDTPIQYSSFLSDYCGGNVWLKLENQQHTGSFKVRGALNKILQLSETERGSGIIAASSGNHAQGVGFASQIIGVEATIVTPSNTPKVKIDSIRRYGVDLIIHGIEYMDAERLARKKESENGKTFVSAYNDPVVVAGQGTTGIEMLEYMPELDIALVPVGGGGLISGVGLALKGANTDIELIGVQSVASPVMHESIKSGRIVDIELYDSVAEGLHGGIEKGSITFELCKKYVDEFIVVQEDTIQIAIAQLLYHQHQIVEGAGAVGVAALLEQPLKFKDKNVGVLISGGNIDQELLRRVVNLI